MSRARRPDRLVLGFDLAATFVFALEGGISAVQANLDLLGVVVVAMITAMGGGIIRDVLLGDTPPAGLRDPHYIVTALVGGVIAFAVFDPLASVPPGILVGLDAAGLSLFAVSGCAKALRFKTNALTAVILGAITAAGGGAVRDVLLNRVPAILYVNVYAFAAVVGAAVMTVGVRRGLPRGRMMAIGGTVCFALRLFAAWRNWGLPHHGRL